MRRVYIPAGILLFAAAFMWSQTGRTVPVFARKYGFDCAMCHSNYPRLNDFGQRYRQNGYQIPGRESEDPNVIDSPPPFAARTGVGFDLRRYANTPGVEELNQFQVNGLDIISAGLLHKGIGYMFIYPPYLPKMRGLEGQPGTLEMASVIFSNVFTPWLNIRIGRFEPAYVAFSAKRRLTISPYEIYNFAFEGGYPLDETQEGIEITGHGRGFEYAVGWLNGTAIGANEPTDMPSDVYVRASHVFGQGEGQTAGQRIGLKGQLGWSRPFRIDDTIPVESREYFVRGGADASFNIDHFNLSIEAMLGQDNKALWDAKENVLYFGGFGELSFLPTSSLVLLGRGDVVAAKDKTVMGLTWRATGAARVYFFDNIALQLEYSYRRQGESDVQDWTQSDHFATARLDFAF